MSETFGTKDSCLWCKSKDMQDARELHFVQKKGDEGELVHVCSAECEQRVNGAMALAQRGIPIFISGLVAMFVIMVIGIIFSFAVDGRLISLMGLGMSIFGLIVMLYPMVTPQTIEMMGMKNGFLIGRVLGVVFLLMGIGIGIVGIINPPGS